jgi:hypothetical protein
MATVVAPVFVLELAIHTNRCPAAYAVIAGLGAKVMASAEPPAVAHQIKASAWAWPRVTESPAAVPTASPVSFFEFSGRLAVTVVCPSTAMDWVKAVAMSLLFASTSDDDMTVPLTKSGYGLL